MRITRAALLAGTALVAVALILPPAAKSTGLVVDNGSVSNNLDNPLYGTAGPITPTIAGAQPDFDWTPNEVAAQTLITFDPAGPFPTALSYFRDNDFAGNVSGSNGTGQTISGFGLGLESTTGGSVGMTNLGTVTSAVDGVDLTSAGGAVTYGGSGDVTGAESGIVTSSGAGQTTINTGGATIIGTLGRAISATAVDGNISITAGGTVTGGSDGIKAATTGDITIDATGGTIKGNGGKAIDAESGNGTVTVTTSGSVTGSSGGIVAKSSGLFSGDVSVNINGGTVTGNLGTAVSASTTGGGVTVMMSGGTVKSLLGTGIDASSTTGGVAITTNGTVYGTTGGISASVSTHGGIDISVDSGTVYGTLGAGINSSIATLGVGGGTANINVNNAGTTVQSLIAGQSGIQASTGSSGTTNINVGVGTTVTSGVMPLIASALGSAITTTASGTGITNINNSGTVYGAGTTTNPVVSIGTVTGTVTITNYSSGLIANSSVPTTASNSAIAIQTSSPAATGINALFNAGTLIGTLTLDAGANTFTNQAGGSWVVSDNAGLSAGFGSGLANTLTNNLNGMIFTGTVAPGSVATFTGLATVNNSGIFYAGNSTTSTTTLNPNATIQTVTNTGTLYVNGTLNFGSANALAGSTFNNGTSVGTPIVGTIDMSLFPTATAPDGTVFPASSHAVTDKVTMGTTATTGTSDLNYTYTFGPAYNFIGTDNAVLAGGNNSFLNVDSNIFIPGSTSDRLIISGTADKTMVNIWDTNANPAAYNPLGITVAAVNGQSSNAFFINGQDNPAHQIPGSYQYDEYEPTVGPMGAIKKEFFFYPLLQDTSLNVQQGIGPNGSRYALYSLPDIEAYQLPIAITAAQNIFHTTESGWLDHQDELRNWQRRSELRVANAAGGGADMPVKARMQDPSDISGSVDPGTWAKAIGSWTNRYASQKVGDLVPAANVIAPFNLGYDQSIYGLLGGFDAGKELVFNNHDAVVFGLMGGYLNSTLNFKNSPTSFRFNGGTVGVSASYLSGGFFADAMFKADFFRLNMSFPALNVFGILDSGVSVTNLGGVGNLGYRWDYGAWYFEPLVTVDYVQTRVGDYVVPGMIANFGNGQSLRGGAGTRFGTIWVSTGQYEVDSSVTAKVWDQFTETQNVTLVTAGPAVTLSDNSRRVFGDVSTQMDITNKGSGWSAFMSGGMQFSTDFTSGTAKGGMHYQF